MTLRVVLPNSPAAAFHSSARRNASIADTIAFFGRIRSHDRTRAANSLEVRVGKALRRIRVQKSALTKVNQSVVVRDTDGLRTAILDEALWYFKVGALQLRHASDSAIRGHPTLGHTSAYYASFYFVSALCRLAGRIPLYLQDYRGLLKPGPTVLMAWDGLVPARNYSISAFLVKDPQGGQFGSHRALWEVFFAIFSGSPDASPDFLEAVRPRTDAQEETVLRNDHTYRPWVGFSELASLDSLRGAHLDQRAVDDHARQLIKDQALLGLTTLATDPAYGPYARACLRASLAARFFSSSAQQSDTISAAWTFLRRNVRDLLNHLGEPDAATTFLGTAIAD